MSNESEFDVPMTYGRDISEESYDHHKIEFQKNTKTKVKLSFPIYEDQDNLEILFKLIREFQAAIDRYTLWDKVGEESVYDYFQQCLAGDAKDAWYTVVTDEDKDSWETNLEELVDTLIGEEAYEAQLDYLKDTKKPAKMPERK